MTHRPSSEDLRLQAQEVLEKQRERVLRSMETLIQFIGWIPEQHLRPEDLEALKFAQKFIDGQSRKPSASETRIADTREKWSA